MHPQIFLIHAITPIHIGNDIGLGPVNLPTMREVHTGYPVIPGSSLKGVLRGLARDRLTGDETVALFGPERGAEEDRRGDLAFGDAQLLALPVRSLYGTFAWATCPLALARLARDLKVLGIKLEVPALTDATEAIIAGETSALLSPAPTTKPANQAQIPARQVLLEDFALRARQDAKLAAVAKKLVELAGPELDPEFFRARLLCVHDDLFAHFARTCLEVRARVKLDPDTGTAAASGPWTEEHLPAESLLCGLVVGRSERPTRLRPLLDSELRLGGRATLGLGRARLTLHPSTPGK